MTQCQTVNVLHYIGHLPMSKITEDQLNTSDVKAVFKAAAASRDKPSGLGKMFKRLQKDTVSVNDLQQAWKEDGFPDDLRDVERILKDHGFADKEIKKVFGQVFGEDENGDHNDISSSPLIQQIADYAKDNGFAQELITFMEREFHMNESTYSGKALIEQVRQVFTSITIEERTARPGLIKREEHIHLGRSKK